jgi:hypothetical protein
MLKIYLEKIITEHKNYKILITGGNQNLLKITNENISYHQNLTLDGCLRNTLYYKNKIMSVAIRINENLYSQAKYKRWQNLEVHHLMSNVVERMIQIRRFQSNESTFS